MKNSEPKWISDNPGLKEVLRVLSGGPPPLSECEKIDEPGPETSPSAETPVASERNTRVLQMERIWQERCAYADAFGFCFGALHGVEMQMEPGALRERAREALTIAREKERKAKGFMDRAPSDPRGNEEHLVAPSSPKSFSSSTTPDTGTIEGEKWEICELSNGIANVRKRDRPICLNCDARTAELFLVEHNASLLRVTEQLREDIEGLHVAIGHEQDRTSEAHEAFRDFKLRAITAEHELQSLRQRSEGDTKRLDWLEREVKASGYSVQFQQGRDDTAAAQINVIITTGVESGPHRKTFVSPPGGITVRSAIDAALSAPSVEGKKNLEEQ